MIRYPNQSNLGSKIVGFSRNRSLMKRNRARKIAKRIKSLVDNTKKSNFRPSSKDEQYGFCSTQALIQNYLNFKQSGVPSRFMYCKNGTWIGFSREIFEFLKVGFLENKPIVEISIESTQYLVDFLRMLQIDLGSGNRRSISWIDVNKKCFFPKVTVDEETNNCYKLLKCSNVKIEIKIEQNAVKRKRNRSYSNEVESDESSSDDHYGAVKRPKINPFVMEKERWPSVEILKDEDGSYRDVKKIFLSGMKRIDQDITITSIHRCLHLDQVGVARIQEFQKQIEVTKADRGTADIRLAWHGTSSEGVAGIMSYGFGITNKLTHSKAIYGAGIYLSPAQSPETRFTKRNIDSDNEYRTDYVI